jgi:hypothetical protein
MSYSEDLALSTVAPIAFFVYKRPEHTRSVINSLIKNPEFSRSPFYVFCDGPKNKVEEHQVLETRRLVRSYNLPNTVFIENQRNIGLAESVVHGVTKLCNEFGRVIVLEDDIVVCPFFLDYMNQALTIYQTSERVMHISAYMYPVKKILPETFFYRQEACWGWGTWQRAWARYEKDIDKLITAISNNKQQWEFNICGSYPFFKMLQKQSAKKIDSWSIQWNASIFVNNGLCLYPNQSLVDNIGNDGTGIHCPKTNLYEVEMIKRPIQFFENKIEESSLALPAMIDFNKKISRITIQRVFQKLKKEFGSLIFKLRGSSL